MPKLIISCDEKWPIFDLEVPEDGQVSNCDIPEDIYRQYLHVSLMYMKIQNILKVYHEVSKRNTSECGFSFPKGSEIEQHSFNTISKATEP